MFINGRILGGDSGFLYVGTYEGDSVIKARVLVQQFDPAVPNVLGVPGDFELHVSATLKGDMMSGTAMLANQPSKSLGIKLIKKADLE